MDEESLIRRIQAAFPDPGWPADRQAHIGSWGDLDCEYIAAHYQGKKWSELKPKELGWMSQDAWAFSDEALRYFLPAWMIDDIQRDWCHMENLSSALEAQHADICSIYTDDQCQLLLELLLDAYPCQSYPFSPNRLIGELLQRQGLHDERPLEEPPAW